ncbi:MAG: hypothetical protein AAGB28_10935 [Pseudomonadota bacterium]
MNRNATIAEVFAIHAPLGVTNGQADHAQPTPRRTGSGRCCSTSDMHGAVDCVED